MSEWKLVRRSATLAALSIAALALAVLAGTARAQDLTWETIVNNGDVMPGTARTLFNSYNQPSINDAGLVVFRARSKGEGSSTGGGEGEVVAAVRGGGGHGGGNGGGNGGGHGGGNGGGKGGGNGGGASGGGNGGGKFVSGIYERNMSVTDAPIEKILDRKSVVPYPNNTGATFNEFPSIPRIAMDSGMIATPGESAPVYEYTLPDGTDTRAGTAGIYMSDGPSDTFTAMAQLGSVSLFSFWQVPGTEGTKFDQFPGAPAVTVDGTADVVVFKGNWTNSEGVGQTGVYYRIVSPGEDGGGEEPVYRIADTGTLIPDDGSTTFGSTAPPSAVGNEMVFLGLDNEDNPTAGGIYLAPLSGENPTLTPLAKIGGPVPGVADATFNKIGEALSFDGHYVSFWGAWGDETRTITLQCPTTGNKDLIADCESQYGGTGFETTEPVNQGFFVTDTSTGETYLVARTGVDGFYNFLYWVFSGEPSTTGSGETESEPARWRSSAFTALSSADSGGNYLVAFKGTKSDGTQGIYEAGAGQTPTLSTVVDTDTEGSVIDPAIDNLVSPTPLMVTSVGIERDGFRNGQLAVSVSMANADASVSWAGLYLTGFPTTTTTP